MGWSNTAIRATQGHLSLRVSVALEGDVVGAMLKERGEWLFDLVLF